MKKLHLEDYSSSLFNFSILGVSILVNCVYIFHFPEPCITCILIQFYDLQFILSHYILLKQVFQFSLHLSSDVDSLVCPTQDLYQSHHAAAPSKALSLQPAQTPVDLRENMHSMMGDHPCEQDVMAPCIPETTKKDFLKYPVDKIGSVRQQKEKSKVECFKNDDISDAVELSIAASEALVIHDLVKTESISETLSTAVLEIALRVKQARLEGSEDGILSSSVESDCSDSLSDLNDFLMEDAYEDIGLPVGVSFEENLCNSPAFHAKGVSGDENYNGGSNIHNERELTSQLSKFDGKYAQKKLEVNVEMEVQQSPDSPPHSLCGDRVTHSDDPGLGANTPKHFVNDLPTSHQYKENNTNDLALNKVSYLLHLALYVPPVLRNIGFSLGC
jgi:hypothetical protein